MRTKFIFAFTKTIRILKLIYGKIIDFRFGTFLKYIALCVVILRCKQRLYEHCIIFVTAGTLSHLPPEYYRWKIVSEAAMLTLNIHEHGARGRMFLADDGGGGFILFLLARTFCASSVAHISTHLLC
jgi:hypothetical protein